MKAPRSTAPAARLPLRLLHCSMLACALAGGCVRDEARHKAAGNILFHNGDLDGAAREYRAAIAAARSDGNAHTLLGNVLFEQGRLDEARASYDTALGLDGKARQARRGLATIALRTGDVAGARRGFEALVDEAPGDVEAQGALGKLLLAQGDLPGAERHLRDALTVAQNDQATLYSLGLTLAREQKWAEALEVFDRLENAAQDRPFADYGRAVVFASSGRTDEALAALAKALDRGVSDLAAVQVDPGLAALKGDPRFLSLLARAHTRAPPATPAAQPGRPIPPP